MFIKKENKNVTMRPLNGWKVNEECDCKRNHSRESFRIGRFMEGSVHWLLPNVFGKTI